MKLTLYPKTKRTSNSRGILLTEKIDGSNLGFFKFRDTLVIAQRNHVFSYDELKTSKMAYKGLLAWLELHHDDLLESLHEESGVFGEWIGMGNIKYPSEWKRFYMFAKANIGMGDNGVLEVRNIIYNHELFIYPFKEQRIPCFIGVVPIISELNNYPSIPDLDAIYDVYKKDEDRDVEGFIIINQNSITKYVRMKNGKFEEHRK